MINKLISEGKYEEALYLLKDKNGEEDIYNRATCLYYLERYDELISFCDIYLENAGNHYYDLLLIEVDCLQKVNNIDKAIALLQEEISMPWIPMQYEEKIKQTYNYLKRQKTNTELNQSPLNRLFDEELYQLLDMKSEYMKDSKKNPAFDIEMCFQCLNVMAKRNIRNFIPQIESFLENPNKVKDLKVIIIEILKEQQVDHNFKYVTNDITTIINPITCNELFKNCDLNEVIRILEDELNYKDISIMEYIKRLAVAYLVMIYPTPVLKEEYKYLAAALYAIANNDMNNEIDLNDLTEKLALNGNLFKKYYDKALNIELY